MWIEKLPRYKPHASQFAFGLRGSCTLLGLAACDVVSKGMGAYVLSPHASDPQPDSIDNVQTVMHRLYQEARQHRPQLCAANGAATEWDMLQLARLIGLPVKEVLSYDPNLPLDVWRDFLRRNIAHVDQPFPVLLQVAHGRHLVDAVTQQADESDLDCHAFALFGTRTDPTDPAYGGYVGCDGDNPGANDHTVTYALDTLAAAMPISLIAFDYVVKPLAKF